jgi:hypothetical protein
MQQLIEWLERLERLEQVPPTQEEFRVNWAESMKRIASPSPLAFDWSIIRIVGSGRLVQAIGQTPTHLGVLIWGDRKSQDQSIEAGSAPGQSLEDQALAAQIGALLTLATNRRIQVGASDVFVTMEGTEQRTFIPSLQVLDSSLTGPVPTDVRTRFEDLTSLMWGLPPEDSGPIGAATELHYASTLLFDVDPNAAYALCVAGLERLSRAYGSPPGEWNAWEDSRRLDQVFREISLTERQADRLRQELLVNRQLRLRQTFSSYICGSLPDNFWSHQVESFHPLIRMDPDGNSIFQEAVPGPVLGIDQFVPRDADSLRSRLLASYDARSSYVHEGRAQDRAMVSTMEQITGNPTVGRTPLVFAGLRQILVSLILQELTTRSRPRPLPNIKQVTPENNPNTRS